MKVQETKLSREQRALLTVSRDVSIPGAAKRPPGRPEVPPEQRLEVVTLRVTAAQKAKLTALGGGEWLRKKIDAARGWK